MSKDIKFNFLNSDEEERYQKHLTLKEIGYEGQLDLKKQLSIMHWSRWTWVFRFVLSCRSRNWENWNS